MFPSRFRSSRWSEPDPDPIHPDRDAVRTTGRFPPRSDERRRKPAFDGFVGGCRRLGPASWSGGRAPANGSKPVATIALVPGATRPGTRARVRSGFAGRRAIHRAHCDARAPGRVAHAPNAAAPGANDRRACGADPARLLDTSGPGRRGPGKAEAGAPSPARLDAGAKIEAFVGVLSEPPRHRPRGTPAVRRASLEAKLCPRARTKPRIDWPPRNSGRHCSRRGYSATKPARYPCAVLIRFYYPHRTLVLISASFTTSTRDRYIRTVPPHTDQYPDSTLRLARQSMDQKRTTSCVGVFSRHGGCQSRLSRRSSHRRCR